MEFTVNYEIEVNGKEISDSMIVEANDAARAQEFATEMLEQQYEGGTLLSCEVAK